MQPMARAAASPHWFYFVVWKKILLKLLPRVLTYLCCPKDQNCPFILAKCVCNRCTMLYSVCYFKIFGGRKAKAMLNQFWRVWGREADRNLPRTAVEFSRIFNPFRFSKGPEKQLGLDNQNKVLHLGVEMVNDDQMLLLLLLCSSLGLFHQCVKSGHVKSSRCFLLLFLVHKSPKAMGWPGQCSAAHVKALQAH